MTGNRIEVTIDNESIDAERRECLGLGAVRLTLGAILLLADAKSPYVYGGTVSADDMDKAKGILDARSMGDIEFHDALKQALDTAFRIYDIAEDDPDSKMQRRSAISFASPEWMTDIIAMASAACPSLTLDDLLWEVPLALVIHLQLATTRRNGAITSRDDGVREALAEMKKRRGANDNG